MQPPYTRIELEAMTKDKLLVIALEVGAQGVNSSNLKADIINGILAVT